MKRGMNLSVLAPAFCHQFRFWPLARWETWGRCERPQVRRNSDTLVDECTPSPYWTNRAYSLELDLGGDICNLAKSSHNQPRQKKKIYIYISNSITLCIREKRKEADHLKDVLRVFWTGLASSNTISAPFLHGDKKLIA